MLQCSNFSLDFVIFQADFIFEYAHNLSSEIVLSMFVEKSHARHHRIERLVATAIDS